MASPYDNIPGKIFIGGIPPVTSQETIQRYFGQFGELLDCVLMQDKATGKSRGFGFVTYKDSHSVDQVLSTTHSIDGKEVDCKRAIPRDQQGDTVKEESSSKTRKLFVGGLPQTTSEEQFRAYFEQFGTIEDSVIMVDKDTGKSRGFGFVTFDAEDAVDRVIQRYYDNKIEGKWVECKRAQPKDMGTAPTKKFGGGKPGKDYQSGGGKGQGYYQDSGSQKSSRSHYGQDTYEAGGFPSNPNYMQGYPDYGPNGYNQVFGGGFDSSYGYNMGYPGDSGYANMYAGFYNNPYGGAYNPAYSQFPQGQYAPMGYGSDPTGAGQMGYQRGGMAGGPGGYNNMQGGYGGVATQASGSGTYGGKDSQQNGSYNKSKGNGSQQQSQTQASQSMNLSPKEGSSNVGPAKSGNTMQQSIESRYYTPY